MTDPAILSLDWALRGGTVALLLLLVAGALGRDCGRLVPARLGVLFALGSAAYAVCSAAGMQGQPHAWAFPLLADAIALAEQILVNGPTALAASKEIIFQSANWTDEESWIQQAPIAALAFDAEDRTEGLRAFAEKRKPVWKGR